MNKELENKLYEDFPKLYRQKDLSEQESCMYWGIAVGDGWYEIVRELSEKLEPLGVEAAQVKEKFGDLRFYLDYGTATKEQMIQAQEYINEAEKKSSETCEACGKKGKVSRKANTWIRTLCDGCRREGDN